MSLRCLIPFFFVIFNSLLRWIRSAYDACVGSHININSLILITKSFDLEYIVVIIIKPCMYFNSSLLNNISVISALLGYEYKLIICHRMLRNYQSINQSNNSNSLTLIRDLSVMLNVKKNNQKKISKTKKNRKEQKSTNKQTNTNK